jgi:mono/diheme cytochrome c family protein
MNRRIVVVSLSVGLVAALALVLSFALASGNPQESLVKRGEYLVTAGSCNDCHTPWKMGPKGPEPDMSRYLSGHPADAKLPDLPVSVLTPDGWGAVASSDMTAWGGPWGVSFTANLTPDQVTGTGAWTPEVFIQTMRTGKHMGAGRAILPPMPWYNLAKLKDDDLRAIFAYLQSLKPISNQVPLPIPPAPAPK